MREFAAAASTPPLCFFEFESANIKQNFGLAIPDLFRVSVLWRRRVLCGELRQLPDVAFDRGERVPGISPSA